MKKIPSNFLYSIILSVMFLSYIGICSGISLEPAHNLSLSDTIYDKQVLYNGRIWRNKYPAAEGNQFLFDNEFKPGSVTMRGRSFYGVMLKYDIYSDEIITPYEPVGVLQLNKEMVSSFSFSYLGKDLLFEKIAWKEEGLEGYFNIAYKGEVTLIVKYIKKIEKLADGGKYDKFYQANRIYLKRDSKIFSITSIRDLIEVYDVNKRSVKSFIRRNGIFFKKDDPFSLIPVLQFVESLPDHQ